MKHLTKENIILVLVSLLVLAQIKEMTDAPKRHESFRAAVQERMKGMSRASQERPKLAPRRALQGEWRSGQKGGAALREKKKKEAKD